MLKIYDLQTDEELPFSDYENLRILHKLNGFENKLSFDINPDNDFYKYIVEETRISYGDNEWLVKKIQDGSVECSLNLDVFKTTIHKNFKSETLSLSEFLENQLPVGWTFEGANVVTIQRTIEIKYCTDYDVLLQAQKTYGVYFELFTETKRLIVYSPLAMQQTGEYLTDELNLRKLSYQGDTKNLITRLYCYGKDGLSISGAKDEQDNDYGLEYIDDLSYSDKIVCGYLEDERFTDPNHLMEYGIEQLAILANPVRSYECDVVDLAKMSDDYSFLDFKLHKKVTLIYREKEQRLEHQIVEYLEYPDEPDRNIVTLSFVPQDIQISIKKVGEEITQNLKDSVATLNMRVLIATAILSKGLGGYTYEKDGAIYILDNPIPEEAQNVWVWNINGFGHSSTGIDGPFSMAMTYDNQFIADIISGSIVRGDLIEAGGIKMRAISQDVTDAFIEQSLVAANGLFESKINGLDGLSNLVSTLISQSASDIRFEFTTAMDADINNLTNIINGNQNLLKEYIRFEGALIELGKLGNVFTAELSNEKLSFKQNGIEIAYISNNRMYITEAEIKTKLTIGQVADAENAGGFFDFIMRSNGNLAMKWRAN